MANTLTFRICAALIVLLPCAASADAWQGPPEDAVGWWKGIIADAGGKRMHWAPNDVMLHYFERLLEDPKYSHIRFVRIRNHKEAEKFLKDMGSAR